MRQRADVTVTAAVTAAILMVGFGFCLAINLPGHLSYDSVIQLLEGRKGEYTGWHPAFMSWLLGLSDTVSRGTAVFVILNVTVFFASLLSLLWLVKKPSWLAAVVALLCLLTPQVALYQGIVWKDILLANTSVAAFVSLALAADLWPRRTAGFALLGVSTLFFVFAALSRQNGILMLPVGAIALGWIAARHVKPNSAEHHWRCSLLTGLVAGSSMLAIGVLSFSLANVALGTRLVQENGSIQQFRLLQSYDVIGALVWQPGYALPDMRRDAPDLERELRSDGVRLYSPERIDTLDASQRVQDALDNTPHANALIAIAWKDLILHHPLLYLKIRAEVFRWVFMTPDLEMCLPVLTGVSGPEGEMGELGLHEREDARDDALNDYARAFIGTPVMSHAAYAFIALVAILLLLRRRRDADIIMAAMLVGALVFTASFFVISLACDYRYLYALDLASLTALFYLALDPRSLGKRSE